MKTIVFEINLILNYFFFIYINNFKIVIQIYFTLYKTLFLITIKFHTTYLKTDVSINDFINKKIIFIIIY